MTQDKSEESRFGDTLAPAFLSSTEEIIGEMVNGRMIILVDHEDRENEGDLIIPAQMATPERINFMATHGRGLICLALTSDRAKALGLERLEVRGGSRMDTAFTASIEAREGVTTGISAFDRARTIQVASDARFTRDDIVSPGHVFPLIARDGGVLVRAGHTEASVDLARFAGLNPAAVICEIMNDDGSMARRDDLITFARVHSLKIGAISDLIAYRRRFDRFIEKRSELVINSRWGGEWTVITFWNKAERTEHVALIKGTPDGTAPTMVRMHRMSHLTDVFGEVSPRDHYLSGAMAMIAAQGVGVVVLLNRPMQGDLLGRLINARASGTPLNKLEDLSKVRDYGAGAQILTELGVQDMILLSSSQHTMVALAGYGLNIVERRPISAPNGGMN